MYCILGKKFPKAQTHQQVLYVKIRATDCFKYMYKYKYKKQVLLTPLIDSEDTKIHLFCT